MNSISTTKDKRDASKWVGEGETWSCPGPNPWHSIKIWEEFPKYKIFWREVKGLCPTIDMNPNSWIWHQKDKPPKYLYLKINRI